jgi:prepilin-type N-terminal cleavage/methylation domain-containing protein
MRTPSIFEEKKGVTLIELLVALVICAVVIGAIYRLFIIQTRAYTVQDEVVEIQQTVRSAMEILLRDLRMTGYDDDSAASTIAISTAIPVVAANSITVRFEYNLQQHDVAYWTDGALSLWRQETIDGAPQPADTLLQNVNNLGFTYGVDTDEDGSVESWEKAVDVGTSKVIAVIVTLTARSTSVNPDVQARVSPRTLTSAVSFRNLIMK